MLSGRGLCDEVITRPEESYRLCCVVVCDLETSRIDAPYIYIYIYIYDISSLRVKFGDGNTFDMMTCKCVSKDKRREKCQLITCCESTEEKCSSNPFISLKPRRVQCGQHHAPGTFTPGRINDDHFTVVVLVSGPVWTKISQTPGFETRTIEPVASRCIDYSINKCVNMWINKETWSLLSYRACCYTYCIIQLMHFVSL